MTPEQAVDLISRFISNLGFPIFVAVWLLMRTDKLLRSLVDAINELTSKIVMSSDRDRERESTEVRQ